MNVNDVSIWNNWRQNYDTTSYNEQVKTYSKWGKEGPYQTNYSELTKKYLEELLDQNPSTTFTILEFGGGKGDYANYFLQKYTNISYWENIELVECFVQDPICKDPRYYAHILDDYLWNKPPMVFDIFIANHVLEHIKQADLVQLLSRLSNIKYMFVEIPLPEKTPDWTNYLGSHILELNLQDFLLTCQKQHFEILELAKSDKGHCMMFEYDPNLVFFKKPLKIMIIGWFGKDKYGYGLAKELELLGHSIIRISTDWQPKEYLDPKINQQIYCENQEVQNRHERVMVADYVKKYPDCDCIFLGQSNTMLFDLKDVYIPTYYYQNEIGYLHIPLNPFPALCGIFYSYYGAKAQIYWHYYTEWNRFKFVEFMPYAINPDIYYDRKIIRSIPLGFMGSWQWKTDNPEFENPIMKDIYKNRDQYLMFLKTIHGLVLKPRDYSLKTMEKWVEFMSNVKIAPNIPGLWGKINERQLFILGLGCVLLQWYYPELEQLGFQNRKNCLWFSNESELTIQITWALTHPQEIETIRQNGIRLAKQHTWKQRCRTFLKTIAPFQEKQKDRLAYLGRTKK